MKRYAYELAVLVLTCCAILHGIVILVADAGRPRLGYSVQDRQQLNWLVMHSTRNIHDKLQGRLSD